MWDRLAWAAELIRHARAEGRRAARSLTTQFVVGAVGESDRELLDTVDRAHRELDLKRAYFSAFHPIERSPFSDLPAEDPTRAFRLYQADFMLRDYGFSAAEMPFDDQGLLPRDKHPSKPGLSAISWSPLRSIVLRARPCSRFPALACARPIASSKHAVKRSYDIWPSSKPSE